MRSAMPRSRRAYCRARLGCTFHARRRPAWSMCTYRSCSRRPAPSRSARYASSRWWGGARLLDLALDRLVDRAVRRHEIEPGVRDRVDVGLGLVLVVLQLGIVEIRDVAAPRAAQLGVGFFQRGDIARQILRRDQGVELGPDIFQLGQALLAHVHAVLAPALLPATADLCRQIGVRLDLDDVLALQRARPELIEVAVLEPIDLLTDLAVNARLVFAPDQE